MVCPLQLKLTTTSGVITMVNGVVAGDFVVGKVGNADIKVHHDKIITIEIIP